MLLGGGIGLDRVAWWILLHVRMRCGLVRVAEQYAQVLEAAGMELATAVGHAPAIEAYTAACLQVSVVNFMVSRKAMGVGALEAYGDDELRTELFEAFHAAWVEWRMVVALDTAIESVVNGDGNLLLRMRAAAGGSGKGALPQPRPPATSVPPAKRQRKGQPPAPSPAQGKGAAAAAAPAPTAARQAARSAADENPKYRRTAESIAAEVGAPVEAVEKAFTTCKAQGLKGPSLIAAVKGSLQPPPPAS